MKAENKNAISFLLFLIACGLAFWAAMCMTSCIYPHELRKDIVQPTYDDWETGYAETSPEIIMAQLDDWDDNYLHEDTCVHVFMVTSNNIHRCIKCHKTQVGIVSSQRTKREFMTVDTIDYSPYDPIIKLSDLITYERECYNDSTFYETGLVIWNIDEDSIRYTDDGYWTHREPTFTGFIQWLQKKQK